MEGSSTVSQAQAEAAVGNADGINIVLQPGQFHHQDAVRDDFPALHLETVAVQHHNPGAALREDFHHGDRLPVLRNGGIVIVFAFGHIVTPAGVHILITQDRLSGKPPAGMFPRFRPIDALLHIIVKNEGDVVGKGPDVHDIPLSVHRDNLGCIQVSFPDDVQLVVHNVGVHIVHRKIGVRRYPLRFHKGGAGFGIGLPDIVKSVQNVVERLFEGLPGVFFDNGEGVGRGNHPGLFPGQIQRFADDEGVVVQVAGAGYGDIAQFIEVGGEVLVGAIAPAVPTAEVALVQGYAVKVQEVGGPGAGAVNEAGFHGDGIALAKCLFQIQLPVDGGPGFAGEPVQETAVAVLQLRLVPGFVGGELDVPGHRVGAVHFGVGVQVHPRRGPADGAVGVLIVGVQHHREFFLHSRGQLQAAAHRFAKLLQ